MISSSKYVVLTLALLLSACGTAVKQTSSSEHDNTGDVQCARNVINQSIDPAAGNDEIKNKMCLPEVVDKVSANCSAEDAQKLSNFCSPTAADIENIEQFLDNVDKVEKAWSWYDTWYIPLLLLLSLF